MRLRNFYSIILAIFLFVFTIPGFSMMVGNYSEISFDENGDPIKTEGISLSIEKLIILSAKYFLKGKSNVDLLAAKLEAAEVDVIYFYELQSIVNDALNNMRTAQYYYRMLKEKADRTPYNQSVLIRLATFDYDSLLNKYGLNRDILDQVKKYLVTGNVRGAYGKFLTNTKKIISCLDIISNDIYYWSIPDRSILWQLNQECGGMNLFGQYMAQVYSQLK